MYGGRRDEYLEQRARPGGIAAYLLRSFVPSGTSRRNCGEIVAFLPAWWWGSTVLIREGFLQNELILARRYLSAAHKHNLHGSSPKTLVTHLCEGGLIACLRANSQANMEDIPKRWTYSGRHVPQKMRSCIYVTLPFALGVKTVWHQAHYYCFCSTVMARGDTRATRPTPTRCCCCGNSRFVGGMAACCFCSAISIFS